MAKDFSVLPWHCRPVLVPFGMPHELYLEVRTHYKLCLGLRRLLKAQKTTIKFKVFIVKKELLL